MRLLIFGAGGQAGTALQATVWPSAVTITALTHAQADIGDAAAVAAAFDSSKHDIVINAAGYTAVDKAESEPAAARRINGEAPGLIAAECARRGAALIHISTDYVFDGAKTAPYLETDPPAPLGVYGASKLAGERAVAERLERHIILRTSWVFSAAGANFVKTMLRLAAAGRDIRVVQDQIGGPTPADDIAWAIAQIAARIAAGPVPWGTYHYCGAPAVSWCEFARAIFEVHRAMTGKQVAVEPISTNEYPTAARRPANSRLDCAKVRGAFGIEQRPWQAGLESAMKSLSQTVG
ncbi:MAG: dTDP-4-dehydrorhamnose reductase [Dongiaceae bacterium]